MEKPSTHGARGRLLLSSERNAVLAVCGVAFGAHLAFAGGDNAAALCITAAYGLTVTALLVPRWGRQPLLDSKAMVIAALFFALTVAAALLSLSPVRLDPPHPVWALVGSPSTPSVDRSRTVLEIIKLLGLACIFTAGAILGRSDARARYLFTALCGFSLVYALWAFVSFFAWPGTFMGLGSVQVSDRLLASFLSANTAGTFFGMLVILGVGLMIYRLERTPETPPGRWTLERRLSAAAIPGALALIAATALLLTASRSAITATGAVLLLLALAEGLARRWRLRTFVVVLLPAALLSAALLLVVSGERFFGRLGNVHADAASRGTIYALHIQAMKPYPWLGMGLGAFEPVHRQLINAPDFGSLWNIQAMHNVYLGWREAAGWLGAAPMFLCIATILVPIVIAAAKRRTMGTQLRIVIAISGVALLHGATDFALEEFSFAGFWALLLGCGLALSTGSS